jgi:hypothetical protein
LECPYELNEYHNKIRNQIAPHSDDKYHNATLRRGYHNKTKKLKKLNLYENQLFELKRWKDIQRGDFMLRNITYSFGKS